MSNFGELKTKLMQNITSTINLPVVSYSRGSYIIYMYRSWFGRIKGVSKGIWIQNIDPNFGTALKNKPIIKIENIIIVYKYLIFAEIIGIWPMHGIEEACSNTGSVTRTRRGQLSPEDLKSACKSVAIIVKLFVIDHPCAGVQLFNAKVIYDYRRIWQMHGIEEACIKKIWIGHADEAGATKSGITLPSIGF